MKKFILILMLALLVSPAVQAVNAEETNASNETSVEVKVENKNERPGIFPKIRSFINEKMEVKKDERQENKNERASDRQENRVEDRQTSFDKVRETWKRNLARMVQRMEAVMERENKILAKIVSRIEKIKSAGGNVETSEKFVEEAKSHFALATTAIGNLKIVIENETATTTASTTPALGKESFSRIRTAVETVKTHIKAGHSAMIRAVVNLRGSSSVNATTTSSVN